MMKRSKLQRVLLGLGTGAMLLAPSLTAHAAAPSDREIVARGDKVLGTLDQRAPIDPNQTMHLQVFLKPRSEAAWQAFVAYSHRPGFVPMTRDQMRAAVSPDTTALVAYMSSQGLRLDDDLSTALNLGFEGTVGQVGTALRVHLVRSTYKSGAYRDTADTPTLPSDVASVVKDIVGLNNYTTVRPLGLSSSTAPSPFQCPSANTNPGSISVAVLENTYQIQQSSITLQYPVLQGQGNIGLMGFSPNYLGDPLGFWSRENVPAFPTANSIFIAGGLNDCNYIFETSIDMEWSGAVAPNASAINVLQDSPDGTGYLDELSYWANHSSQADVVSSSYGYAETDVNTTFEDNLRTDITAMSNAGIPFLAATGECGGNCSGTTPVGVPACVPNAVGVGGTTLASIVSTIGETAWNSDYSGFSNYFQAGEPTVAIVGGNTFQAIFQSQNVDNYEGTSFSSPIWGGIYADAYQFLGHHLAPNDGPISAAYNQNNSSFNDVTSGGTGSVKAHSGFDYLTGYGSPNTFTFFQALQAAGQ